MQKGTKWRLIATWLVVIAIAGAFITCNKEKTAGDVAATSFGPFADRATILFGGDTSFGENYGKRIRHMLKSKGYDYTLAKLKPIMMSADFSILNLETPITDLKKSPFRGNKTYIHWTHPKKTPRCLKEHKVRVVMLANNHTLDFGLDGLKQTFDVLRKSKIEWIGAGLTEAEAARPLVVELAFGDEVFHLAVIAGFAYSNKYDKMYHFYAKGKKGGANKFSIKKTAAQIKLLDEKYPGIFVIVSPHWGGNYSWRTRKQQNQAQQLIDAGADLIIGHGGHRLQEIERYNDHWIVYGLGNFMFNSPGRYAKLKSHAYSLAAQLIVEHADGRFVKSIRAYPIYSDNLITKYQPRPVTAEEFTEAYGLLAERSGDAPGFEEKVVKGEDQIGRYLAFSIE